MVFTKLDGNLLTRVVRRMRAAAVNQDASVSAAITAGDLEAAKERRAEAGRIHRDLRELADLKRRLDAAVEAVPERGVAL